MKKILFTFSMTLVGLYAFSQISNARVQAIHNSADAAADTVDIYANTPAGALLLLDDVAFRNASPFVDVPAGVPISLSVAPKNSTSIADSIPGLTFDYTLAANETYVLIAEGIVSPMGYSPATPFDIKVYAMGREAASMMSNTDVLVHHGATDAPCVDVDELTAGNLVDNACYGDFAGYLELATADYTLAVKDETGTTTVATYSAPLSTLSLNGAAIVVVASGFLDPSVNSNGPAFGLYAALPTGGELVALPQVISSINTLEVETLSLFPNPANDVVRLTQSLSNSTVVISDITGKNIDAGVYSYNNDTVDISNLPKGTYILTTISEGIVTGTGKFVKI